MTKHLDRIDLLMSLSSARNALEKAESLFYSGQPEHDRLLARLEEARERVERIRALLREIQTEAVNGDDTTEP